MVVMRRISTALAATAVLLVLPSAAGAAVTEIGPAGNPFLPSCPGSPCFAVSRTTGYQVNVGTHRALMKAPESGRIVAWSMTLSKPSTQQIKYFNRVLGGPAQAAISVIRPGKKLRQTLIRSGPTELLTPYFGSTTTFPLTETLYIRKGDLVGLTVPSWAPALQISLGDDTAWRASRSPKKCKDNTTQTAHFKVGKARHYGCFYKGARLTYSATFIPNPVTTNPPPKTKPKKG